MMALGGLALVVMGIAGIGRDGTGNDVLLHSSVTVVGLALFAAGAWITVTAVRASKARPTVLVKVYPALIVAKRFEVAGQRHARTNYCLTLEFRTGRRNEYAVPGEFYGLFAEDDIGVAYIRATELLTFKTLPA